MIVNTDCTVYHKYVDAEAGKQAVKRFYIPLVDDETGVFWDGVSGTSKFANGVEAADKALIVINYLTGYVQPKAYEALTDKTGFWTLSVTDKIVRGSIPEDVSHTDLEDLYDDVLNITSVDNKLIGSEDMWHIEVGAK